ncbi:ferredoxin [Bremerella sp. P1]|uniref:ferredoxin n=1 Tax=Bremerella sp. P1 TaxID=3026424 RepID=UPI0023685ED6|nr:ferredoxin [Bremerella sp. P1]WDI39766.1 ferredoxin [Bremerella sp. P1]
MSEPIKPHPENVEGPFYVEYGCCTACDVPMVEAPGLFAYDSDNHCYLKRQPNTAEEITNAIGAAWNAELQCIRYRGDDADVLRRLAELDLRQLCDVAPPTGIVPCYRNHVTFVSEGDNASRLAKKFQKYLISLNVDGMREFRFREIEESGSSAAFAFAWYDDDFHDVYFSTIKEPKLRWHIWHPVANSLSGRGVGNLVFNWLSSDFECNDVRWYTEFDWNDSNRFQRTPW